jgi:pimeloyl-ACP methyl ester carboxylesterase
MRGEFVDVGPGRIYYYAAGTRGAGDPVVLVHGFPMSSRLWHGVVRDFIPGHRLIVVDLPGYGRSDPPHAGGTDSAANAAALRALLDDLGDARAIFVGHGLGGTAVQGVMAQWPERVSGAVLISCPALGERAQGMARLARLFLPLARFLPAGTLASLVHGSMRQGFVLDERSRLTLDTCLKSFTTANGRDALAEHLRQLGRDDSSVWSRRLGEIAMPVALLWGEDDPFLSPMVGVQMQASIDGATIEVVAGVSHFVPEDAPDRVKKAIEGVIARIPTLPPAA